MTIPATISTTAALISLLMALLTLGMSRAPGWRELRWFSGCAVFAALFCASNIPLTLGDAVSERTMIVTSMVVLCSGGLHSVFWIKYAAAHQRRSLTRPERYWVLVGIGFSLLALVPGLYLEARSAPRPISFLHVTYWDSPPSA